MPDVAIGLDGILPVNTEEKPTRRQFVQKVYAILVIAVTTSLANVVLSLFFMSRFGGVGHHFDVHGAIIYLAIGLTFFTWFTITHISLRSDLDFTGHKLFIWAREAIWLFVFIGLWAFTDYPQMLVLWATLGLIIAMMQLAVDTQMVCGGLKSEFSVDQYLMAPLNLYWDIMLLFMLMLPILGTIVNSLMELFSGSQH